MTLILVVDDDDLVSRSLQKTLKHYNYDVMTAASGVECLQLARRHPPDLFILDVMMPGPNGYQVCQEIRKDPSLLDTPVLFLTAKTKDEDKINGFKAGCDDYLAKPFNMQELSMRVEAILRRSRRINPNDPGSHLLAVGSVTLNCRTFIVTTPHQVTLLTNVQFDLLYHLMNHPDQVFNSQQLLQDVWDYPRDTGSPDLVRAHIKNLREKIERHPANPKYILTVRGHGYSFSSQENRA